MKQIIFATGNAGKMKEIREILNDIVRDDKRAGDVIHHMRAMVQKKGAVAAEPLDFNKLVEVVLAMKPADAAVLMNDLSSVQCARVLAALDAKSAAKILAQMDDERAAAIGLYVVQYTN